MFTVRLAIIGSRNAPQNIAVTILKYVPANTSEIVSGGAQGVDMAAQDIAALLSLPLRVFAPNYERFGKQATLLRNEEIICYADEVLAFWDGISRGTMHSISLCIKHGKPIRIIPIPSNAALPHQLPKGVENQ